jgi:outer membrane protein assembly factor BamB
MIEKPVEPATGPAPAAPKSHRLWIPFGIGSMALAGILVLYFKAELDLNFKSWAITVVAAFAALLELGWFVLLSRYGLRWRLATFGLFVLLIAGLKETLRVDGTVNGTGLPRLAWRWAVRRAPPLGAEPDVAALGRAPLRNATGPSADVPQFFGPNRDGIVKNARLSTDWKSTPPKELWRHAIGEGWSAFAVVEGRAYTEEQRGDSECVTCYDLLTGGLIWSHSNAAHFSQWQSGDGPHATPSVYQGRVFAMGATGILNCLDAATGRVLWLHNILAENHLPNLTWGVSVSPLVFGDTVVVTGGQSNGPTVLAYRGSNGEPLWRAGTDKASYASPILAVLAGRRVVLSCNAASLTAHDPTTGRILLDYPWTTDKWPKASQPVVLDGDRVFLSAGYGSGCMLLKVNAGSNGTLVATPLWKNLKMKTQFNSVAARNGFVYGLDDGMLACVELSTGERKWKEGRYGYGQTLLVDDLVLVQSETGDVVLAEAQPGGDKELGRIPALRNKTWNHPTLAGRFLLVRNGAEAVCYELPVQGGENANLSARIEH